MMTCILDRPRAVADPRRGDPDGLLLDNELTIGVRQLVARHPELTADPLDDLRQDAALMILPKLAAYDPARSSWRTYISRITRHALANAFRIWQRRLSRQVEISCAYIAAHTTDEQLGDLYGLPLAETECTYTDATDHYYMSTLVKRALTEVTPLQRAISEALMAGERITDCARRLHLPRTQVYRELRAIGHALLAAGLEVPHV